MPWFDFFWTPNALTKITERGISQDEVEELVTSGLSFETSRTTGLPLVRGYVSTGQYLVVAFRYVGKITIEIVSAFIPNQDSNHAAIHAGHVAC